MYQLIKPLLFQLEPEKAHYLTLKLLKFLFRPSLAKLWRARFPNKPTTVFGLQFPNPVGLAAGLDKDGEYIDALLGLGFGFIEIGGVTPRAQPGNPRPRIFRIPKAEALINRMGFPSKGIDYVENQLKQRKLPGIVGVNLGMNKSTDLMNAADDYLECMARVYPYVDFVTINISSPNTPGLRDLQDKKYLDSLMAKMKKKQEELVLAHKKKVALLIKISPDISEKQLIELLNIAREYHVDGLIVSNTSTDHSTVLQYPYGKEAGGLSGRPILTKSNQLITKIRESLGETMPIIAVGGIFSAEDAQEKLDLGANLIQIYTGLIYKGPGLVSQIIKAIQ